MKSNVLIPTYNKLNNPPLREDKFPMDAPLVTAQQQMNMLRSGWSYKKLSILFNKKKMRTTMYCRSAKLFQLTFVMKLFRSYRLCFTLTIFMIQNVT